MKKRIRQLYYKLYLEIHNFFEYRSPIFIGTLNIFKLYLDWWKARKVFHRPILKVYKMNADENILGSDYFFMETEVHNKWLYFNVHRCEFKLKYGEIRFENVPYVCLIWRNKVKWIFGLEAPLYSYSNYSNTYDRNNLLYWEGILNYIYHCNKDIIKTYDYNIWSISYYLKDLDENGNNKKIKILDTILPALKNRAAETIIKYIRENHEENKSNNNEA